MSARANLQMRQTVRETWLRTLIDPDTGNMVAYHKFFICKYPPVRLAPTASPAPPAAEPAEAADPNAAAEAAAAAAAEAAAAASATELLSEAIKTEISLFNDVVEFDCEETYRNSTYKVFAMYEWAHANVKNASFFFSLDDDLYVRTRPILEVLSRRTPSRFVWGSMAYLSGVVRNVNDYKEYCSVQEYPLAEIYPLYPRGPFTVLSWDLLRVLVDNQHTFHKLHAIGDVSLGIYLFQLHTRRRIHLNIDDRDEKRFALKPQCANVFNGVTKHSWIVHHVYMAHMRCMWKTDLDHGVYVEVPNEDANKSSLLPYFGKRPRPGGVYVLQNTWETPPDLCHCSAPSS